jgi:hypothetical protein
MFATVHRAYVSIAMICALFFMSALPWVVRSQEETTQTQTTTPETTSETASLLNVYPTEGVPGGGEAVGDFVVGPGKADLTILPGQSKTIEMTVTNRTGERRRFNITVEDAMGSQDVGTSIVLLGDDRGPYSVRDYVTVPHTSFDLDHNQRARIPVTISLPADAEPGGLYGSVLIDTVAIEAQPGDSAGTVPQSAIVARIGTLFFITIPGAVEKDGNLEDFTTVPERTFYQGGPITFGLLYENRGSIHLAPYGELRIKNMFGEEVGFLELDPWFVLPQSLRLREVTWNRDFLFGKYTATVYINRSYDDQIDELSYSFWVLPWKLVLGAFAALFIVFFLIRSFFKNFEFKRKP